MDPRLEDYVEIHSPEMLEPKQECLVLLKDENVARKAKVKNHQNKQARLWVDDLYHDKFFKSDFRVFVRKKNIGIYKDPLIADTTTMGARRSYNHVDNKHGRSESKHSNDDVAEMYSRGRSGRNSFNNVKKPRTQVEQTAGNIRHTTKYQTHRNCPGRHGLQYDVVPDDDFTCDICKYMLPVGSGMFSCRICDWDCCADCTENANHDNAVEDEVEETYEVGEQVLVFYGPLLYNAQVVEIDPEDDEPYLVHFAGWNQRHDLWVPLPNMVKLTPDSRLQQKELQLKEDLKQAKKRASRKRRRR